MSEEPQLRALATPAQYLQELDLGARKLDKAAADLGQAIMRREELEQEVEKGTMILAAQVYEALRKEARSEDRKSIPGEDVRKALVYDLMSDELKAARAELSGVKARGEALMRYMKGVADAISARQSIINRMEDEQSAQSRRGAGEGPAAHDTATGEVYGDDPPF